MLITAAITEYDVTMMVDIGNRYKPGKRAGACEEESH